MVTIDGSYGEGAGRDEDTGLVEITGVGQQHRFCEAG